MGLIDDLRGVVGAEHVLTEASMTAMYTTDWTRRFTGTAFAVVRPSSTAQVGEVLRLCSRARRPVLPQGGLTGLVGAGVPGREHPVILSTQMLKDMREVDQHAGQVTVGAGVLLADLQDHARKAGWEYGVDMASRGSATVGGTIATNAGGIRTCAYGMTRIQVAGLEAVLADGTVISDLKGLPKDNTGYDLIGLFVGSEGTLGVVTAATVRLRRPPGPSTLALVGVRDYAEALQLITAATAHGEHLLAAEIMDQAGTSIVCEMAQLPWPLASRSWPLLLLLEVEGPSLELPEDSDAVLAFDSADYHRLWSYREEQSEAATVMAGRHSTIVHKLDVSVPLGRLQEFADRASALLDANDEVEEVTMFGHIAEGNLHLEIAGPDIDDNRATESVLRLVGSLDGSISAEHGVGRAKAGYLSFSRSTAEIDAMSAIKRALDPLWLMAPGVLLPEPSSNRFTAITPT